MTTGTSNAFHEFLESDVVSLQAFNSTHVFKVHKALLDAKCEVIASAFNSNFTEGRSRVYTFSDSSEDTLARFLEWAYRGDYAEPVVKHLDKTTDQAKKAHASDQLESLDHPLVAHMALLIFSEKYIVPKLRDFVFAKIKVAIQVMNKPYTANDRLVLSLS
ncbi:hypothetical protein ABOM_003661 [Aspergillus bombycis]|uniref:BTB domain-containing protein n=1 Tax=Aspergillus bombycis TaxID=109264 RepID=A0A1F8A5W1_9EURO|nr:hypothetical protein ABOM_003661 [Aspergillus bombycis]OGM47073.1 hypothetical protein ABOM_003661 [Aspergillus bombycis]